MVTSEAQRYRAPIVGVEQRFRPQQGIDGIVGGDASQRRNRA